MRLCHALLVVVDISGYTQFITQRGTSLMHAEQIITELMEAVIDRASLPLTVNKLQGDAALLYREYLPDQATAAATDVLAQVGEFFQAFKTRLGQIRSQRSHCNCDACSNIADLCLKAFVHAGEIAIKQVRQFEELAGEPLILIHRIQKNTVQGHEYVLVSDAVRRMAPKVLFAAQPHRENVEGLGEEDLWLSRPGALPALLRGSFTPAPATPAAAPVLREKNFQHVPKITGPLGWWLELKKKFAR